MIQTIQKRTGQVVKFDQSKITNAIFKAAQSVGGDDLDRAVFISNIVMKTLSGKFNGNTVTVEEVQDVIEDVLIKNGHAKTAKSFILYRDLHRKLRDVRALIDANELINGYLDKSNWMVNENANMTYSLQGLNNHIFTEVNRAYWLNTLYPKAVRDAHNAGDIHISDLYLLTAYCAGWDLEDLLILGFGGVPGKLECAPPKHFSSALGQAVNFLYTLQGEVAGAVAFSNFDTLLAPFIAFDNLDEHQVKQCLQEFLFNCNVPTRVGFQMPFTNITLDITVPDHYKDKYIVIGGEAFENTYAEFQSEMDLFNKVLAELMLEGDAHGNPFSFPIPTISITKDFDWDNPVLDPLWDVTRKYGIYYFANYINSDMAPSDVRSMCPLHPDTKVVTKAKRGIFIRTLRQIYAVYKRCNTEYKVLHNGSWINAIPVKTKTVGCLEIVLSNGTQVIMDKRHEQIIKRFRGGKIETLRASEIEKGMWLPFNATAFPTNDCFYTTGLAVGAFIGDGSLTDNGFLLCLNDSTKKSLAYELKEFFKSLGFTTNIFDGPRHNLFLRVGGLKKAPLRWIQQFVNGQLTKEKGITAYSFSRGVDFLSGLLDGWYRTDGGNTGRIYTASKKLVEDFKVLCSLLGRGYRIEGADTRDGRYSNAPVYTLKVQSKKAYKNSYFQEDDYWWYKVKDIKNSNYVGNVYCLAVDSKEHLFQLSNGLVTHNCRLRLDLTQLTQRGGGRFGANALTGSLGVVTLNMARIGYTTKTKQEFLNRVGELMDIAKESLLIKRKVVENLTEQGLYPYAKHYLKSNKARFGGYWGGHFNTIGLCGMNESALNYLGEDLTTQKAQRFAEDVLKFMNERLLTYQEETGKMFNLEATPAESLSYRFALLDKARYPDIITAGEDEPYYTNSTQLPVDATDDLFQALEWQDKLQILYTSGTVFHAFLGEHLPSIKATKSLVKKIAENFKLPYFTLTPTFSICPTHGYISGEHSKCPRCGADALVYSRVVGYLRPVQNWNKGKQEEYKERKVFTA